MTLTAAALGATLLALAATASARGQCLPWPALLHDAADGRLAAPVVKAYAPLGDWELHQTPTAQYWQYVAPITSDAPAGAETRLELHRVNQQPQPDVVYKTATKACLIELRSELRHAKLKSEAVTCLECEAERFTGEGFVVTLYNQQALFEQHKASHPFVLVLHSTAAPTPGGLTNDTGGR